MTSVASGVEEAQVDTSSEVQSVSLGGRRRNTARGLCGKGAEDVAPRSAGESGGVRGSASSFGSGAGSAIAQGAGAGLQQIGAAGLVAKELSGEFSLSEHLFLWSSPRRVILAHRHPIFSIPLAKA